MTHLLPITVVVPTRNEERMLGECLSRLTRFAKVIVVDSDSKDRTVEIARAHGAEVLTFEWNGRFPKKRNWTLANYEFRTPWVFFLDADELVSDAFCDELAATLPTTNHVGFWVAYTNWFLGRRLRHGGANRKLALFRVGAGEYERIDDTRWSSLDMEVHEHPILVGSTGAIRAVLEHKDDRGYAHCQAQRLFHLGGSSIACPPAGEGGCRATEAHLASKGEVPWGRSVLVSVGAVCLRVCLQGRIARRVSGLRLRLLEGSLFLAHRCEGP